MTPIILREKLEHLTKHEIDLIINDNKSIFLHVLLHKNRKVKLSLHRLFLKADDNILNAIVSYILNNEKKDLATIKIFANDFYKTANYPIDPQKIITLGRHHDLKEIFDTLNQTYFDKKLDLSITWMKTPRYKKFSHMTFGSYDMTLKLIRINQLLDSPDIPTYFLSYVIYHEMLHYIYPQTIDSLGRRRLHTPEFHKKLKEFSQYKEATLWEKEFFKNKKRWIYVRA
ncbi:MAG: hypothetical protein HZB76_04125 [Chlamydiae bacterium]|nr:hypothetical protein [Chlamydiota bacterium]